MKLPFHHFPRPLALLAMLAVLTVVARAGDDDSSGSTARVKFSDPAKPGTLKLSLPWAEARITATEGNEVVVTSSLDQKGRKEVDHEGFRRLDEDVTFDLSEKDNIATITIAGDNPWTANGTEFDIKVPRNTNLILRTEAGGDIDSSSMNGDVVLRDLSSSAVVNTMNGEISATFKHAPAKPVSLSSMNGEIDLRLPGDTKANLRMRTHNGSIRTNFAEGVLQAKTEKTSRTSPHGRLDIDTQEIAHLAAEGARAGMEIARQVVREVSREASRIDREQAKHDRELAKTEAEAARAAPRAEPAEAALPVPAIAPMAPVAPIPPLPNFGGKSIIGTLNGGGIDIKLTSMNGTITLRETK